MPDGERQPPRAEVSTPTAGPAPNGGPGLASVVAAALGGYEVAVEVAGDEPVVTIRPQDVAAVCRILKDDPGLAFDYLRCLSVVDYVESLSVVYHLLSLSKRHKVVVKTSVPPDEPRVPTVTSVWRASNWFEREGHDLYGVVFDGHPDLSPLLLYEGFEGYPGRRSFPFHDYDEW